MPPDHSAEPAAPAPPTLSDWFATPQGSYVLEWERRIIDDVVADIFGYYALQVGQADIDFLRASRITWRGRASLDGRPAVVADAHELPFASESLDLVLLPHLLEATSEPHLILREVERVLRPEGEVVISGFNPLSLWGVKRLFGWAQTPPWDAEFVSVPRMKDWMTLLNFEMRGGRFGCYRPPFASEKWLSRLGFLEAMGRRWWPVAGAVYVIRARKRVAGLRIITPARQRARRAARLVATTARGMEDAS
jgi:SAM-dependent methyltransferase